MSAFDIMALPFAECLVLVGIHSYLGIHVIKRRVIFVDLALAQIAALGATVAFLFGIHPHSHGSYLFSLGFTVIGASIFSLTRTKQEKIPQEAIIGLVYALAAAISVLVIARAPHGAEHIKEILTGSILWVRGKTVLSAALAYSGVGLFHFFFKDKFLAISENADAAEAAGINVRLWDFLFYLSFGVVITHSVETAGVLLVFVFLVVPAIIAIMLTDRLLYQLIIGWSIGTIVSVSGLAISYYADLSTGPTVVAFYGFVLLVMALAVYVIRAKNRMMAVRNIAIGMLAVLLIAWIGKEVGNYMGKSEFWSVPTYAKETHAHEHMKHHKQESPEQKLFEKLSGMDLESKQLEVQKIKDNALLIRILEKSDTDYEMLLAIGKKLASQNNPTGFEALIKVMSAKDAAPLIRSDAADALHAATGQQFGYDALDDPASENNAKALQQWKDWIEKTKGK